jgi:hypothetical protein
MGQTTERKSRIPDFASLKEEAEFWDTHSLAEFEDELEPVEVEVARPLRHSYRVPLENDEFYRILALAKQRDLRPGQLLSQWVKEGLARAEVESTSNQRDRATAD